MTLPISLCRVLNIYTPHGNAQTAFAACMVRSNDDRRRTTDIFVDGIVPTEFASPPTNMVQFSSKLSRNDDIIDILLCCMQPVSLNTFDIRRCGVVGVLFL